MLDKRKVAALIAIITLLIYLIYHAFFFHSKAIITLEADQSPTKKKPEDPGGIVLPNSDSLVYDKLQEPKKHKVNILPGPESPIEINRRSEPEPQFVDSIDEILANIEYYENELLSGGHEDEDGVKTGDSILPNKRQLKTDPESKDENIVPLEDSELRVIKAEEDRYHIINYDNISAEDNGYKVQLTAAYSSADAVKRWKNISTKYGKILQNKRLITKKVNGSNDRIFFLVMAGVYSSSDEAKRVCRKLMAAKQHCIVVK